MIQVKNNISEYVYMYICASFYKILYKHQNIHNNHLYSWFHFSWSFIFSKLPKMNESSALIKNVMTLPSRSF